MPAPRAGRNVVVLVGGDPVAADVAGVLPSAATIIAADSGLAEARRIGVPVDLVVGDMDSVDDADLAAAVEDGARVERHPTAKDATDLELALDAAVTLAPASITVVGGGGGRLDHLLAGTLLLAAERYAGARVTALLDGARVTVVRGVAELTGDPGGLVTLLAVHGPAVGVRTAGLRFALAGERLEVASTRGVSNVLTGRRATVHVDSGVLLAIQPGASPSPPTTEGGRR